MAARLLVSFFLLNKSIYITSSQINYSQIPAVNNENRNRRSNDTYISSICYFRDSVCESNDSAVCALRLEFDGEDFKTYNNSCFLFFSNMCENTGDEYYIIQGGSCDSYLSAKRAIRRVANETVLNNVNAINGSLFNENGTLFDVDIKPNKTALRSGSEQEIEEEETTFDGHICPLSCPDVYSPVCIIANMGQGKYFKYFTFVNQCLGYLYYCKHSDQFKPPPEEYEDVKVSPLGWSYCGAYRYLQFSRFSEVVSSMGHYGWLAGNQKYSHIMEPHERMPGYG